MGNELIHIEQCGFLTTIQDAGRTGYLQYGVSKGGAMDFYSMKLANILAGNDENESVLEITQSPHRFRFLKDVLVSFTGGGLHPTSNQTSLVLNQPLFIESGTTVEFKQQIPGFRLYMSVAGGIEADAFLKSQSTDLLVKSGGFRGRALKKDDVLQTKNKLNSLQEQLLQVVRQTNFTINHTVPSLQKNTIRVLNGAEWDLLTDAVKQKLSSAEFTVTTQSSRMGYRLKSSILTNTGPTDIISSPVTQGTVQLTSSGELIVLMADAQTIGGYPRVLQVIEADLHAMAQKKPGDTIQFERISLEDAEDLLVIQLNQLASVHKTIQRLYAD